MITINGDVIFEGITLLFALIALVIIFVIVQKTGKKLRESYLYLFLGAVSFVVSKFVGLLNGLQIWFGHIISSAWAKLFVEVMEIAFMVLFIIGVWKMHQCIHEVNNKINKKTKK